MSTAAIVAGQGMAFRRFLAMGRCTEDVRGRMCTGDAVAACYGCKETYCEEHMAFVNERKGDKGVCKSCIEDVRED